MTFELSKYILSISLLSNCYYVHSFKLLTFRVRRRRGEMQIDHGRLCVYVCLSVLAAFPHYCTDPDVSWGNSRGDL